ncbi:MAG TPA: (Fe-S)-binding protein, partial [Bacteroidales bacterium]
MLLFNWFVIPFTLGLAFLLTALAVKYTLWIKNLPADEKAKARKGVFSKKSFEAIREVFMESLLHRKIFRVNPLLGYMHASLAFGWFLLILVGNLESRVYSNGHMSPPYVPIFFRFFNPNAEGLPFGSIFAFVMDLFLLIVLTGVALAWFKRVYSRMMGMKKTTVLKLGDKLALSSLWLIFPLRFLAESFTSANAGGGSFLTANAGHFFGSFLPTQLLAYPAWWAYSLSLGIFFVSVPYSRYMHIPTEVLLIFLRKYGVSEKKEMTTFTRVEVSSCSRCGICLDPCQMASAANMKKTQSVYYLQSVRNKEICDDQSLNCMMCGRCDNICPVGIDIKSIRLAGRKQLAVQKEETFHYIPKISKIKADVIYFAGCMTHLQPSVKKSMVEVMKAAGEKFWFMDENGSACCGRPMMLSGKEAQARELMAKNKTAIEASGARTFVTSCPICYKVFKEEYNLNIEVLHHSQYLLQLVENRKIEINRQHIKGVYHDPCELGRGSGIYDQPRQLLSRTMELVPLTRERKNALCCGGSLANLKISTDQRKMITTDAIK